MAFAQTLVDTDETWQDQRRQRADDFRALLQMSRRSRLGQGALVWQLLRDVNQPGRFIEQIIDESWREHLRRFDRGTASDVAMRERKLAFHLPEEPPVVARSTVGLGPFSRTGLKIIDLLGIFNQIDLTVAVN